MFYPGLRRSIYACGYDPDKSVLRRKEWDRRSQESQPSEEIFFINHTLFSEPYKTNKGDELSTRIQSTLGNYDEMKELFTEKSNQSYLVGIPKTEAAKTPTGKTEESIHQIPTESHYLVCHTIPTSITPSGIPAQLNNKNKANMNWQLNGHSPEEQNVIGKTDQRKTASPSTDFKCALKKYSTDKNKNYILNPETSTSNDQQHNILTCGRDKNLTRRLTHSKLNCSLAFDTPLKEKSCTKNSNGLNSLQNFPASIISKLNSIQQKPTAYVRPMDGQDQATNVSPKLKLSTQLSTNFPTGLSNKADADILENPKIETCGELSQKEDNHHYSNMGFCSPKCADLKVRSPSVCAAQISMLEEDLKLSSDEDECQQPATKGQAIGAQIDSTVSGDTQKCSSPASGVSIKGSSSSSSESDTSSESDSETESSSSESGRSKPSACTSPEPEQATSNKWQLDKWLNKVNPNKTAVLNHTQSVNPSRTHENKQSCTEESKDCYLDPGGSDDQSPSSNNRSQETVCSVLGIRGVNLQSSPPTARAATIVVALPAENTSASRPVCRKLTRRTERTSSGDNLNCHKSDGTPLSQAILGNEILEQAKNRLTCNSKGSHKKELRPGLLGCENRRTRITRSAPKSKELVEYSVEPLEHGSETELDLLPLSKISSASPSENSHRLKECSSDIYSTNSCVNARTRNHIASELEEQLYTLVPFGRNDNVCSLKGSEEIKSLWVRIDLSLLTRIPQGMPQENYSMNFNMDKTLLSSHNEGSHSTTDNGFLKMRRKRKCESEQSQETKKTHIENGEKLLFSMDSCDLTNCHSTDLSSLAMCQQARSEKCMSPLLCLLEEPTDGFRSNGTILNSYPSCNQHQRSESLTNIQQRSIPVPSESSITVSYREDLQSDMWSSDFNGHNGSRKTKQSLDSTKPRNADYFMQEAKRMKHKADAMVDKFDKVLNYTEAALSFIECGNAMEHGPMESKSPYTMYSETVELIRYALRIKSHSSHSGSVLDKKITALCYRCLALLYWRMFRLKRDHAVKYSKALIDYFKNSSKAPRISSSWSAKGKTSTTLSPMSPSPSPVSSSGSNSSTSTSIISIPQRIHQMAANHVSITNSILHSYDYWEIADNLTKDNTEFFNELDTLVGPITLHSSMEHLVQYTRQGLSWIRQSSHHVL
ncbi:AF4/FMR2 family member 3 isoform X2 [Hyperolius riggenbachi]|uniref:AF4/FMR2 family member 3 isoform X2 n=1 Tax=Hyperolius riggenbachi TaxID=752182 RepID=UPI0035A26CD3